MFATDLKRGEKQEYRILDRERKKYPDAYKMEGYHKEDDIYVPETDIRLEVKFDEKSIKTGNYAIECEYDGSPSGVVTTTADFWIIINREIDIWISVWWINNVIEQNGYRPVPFTPHGEEKPVKAFLIPVHKLQIIAEYYEIHS